MGVIMNTAKNKHAILFNGPLEIGLRSTCILNEAYPEAYSLQRLVILDYLVVHSDDIEGGPEGLHPQTPYRSGEILVRRDVIQRGLYLFMSRNLVERRFEDTGIVYTATERTGAFLDVLNAKYTSDLRERSAWVISRFESMTDAEMEDFARLNIDKWGTEFETESVLWMEESI